MRTLEEIITKETIEMLKALPEQKLGPRQKHWLEGLRSGEYKQSSTCLADYDGNACCLGVRCDQLAKAGEVEEERIESEYTYNRAFNFERSYLPEAIRKSDCFIGRAGDLRVEIYVGASSVRTLAGINDQQLMNFEEIASLVETYPALVFTEPA